MLSRNFVKLKKLTLVDLVSFFFYFVAKNVLLTNYNLVALVYYLLRFGAMSFLRTQVSQMTLPFSNLLIY